MTDPITREQFLIPLLGANSYWGREAYQALAAIPGDPAAMWGACMRGDALLWAASWAGVDHRRVILAACAAVRPVLRYVPGGEGRPGLALEAAEARARGDPRATLERVRWAADHAATAASDAFDAAGSQTSDPISPHQAHASYAAAYAAYAAAEAADAAYVSATRSTYAARAVLGAVFAADRSDRHRSLPTSLAASADLVRQHIPWPVVEATLAKRLGVPT